MEEALKKFGLSDNEIKVYLACLKLGDSSVTRISQQADIYRTLTYEILKTLAEKGLVSYVIKEKKKHFEAAHPEKLIDILKEKERRIKDILPELSEIRHSIKKKTEINLYEGKEGIKTVLEEMLRFGKSWVAYSSVKHLKNILDFYFPNFVQRRIKAGIKIRLVVDGEPITKKLLDYRILKRDFATATFIVEDKVAILSLGKEQPIGLIIEDKEIAKTQLMIFELMWKAAKKK